MQQYTSNVAGLGIVNVNDYSDNTAQQFMGASATQINYLQQLDYKDNLAEFKQHLAKSQANQSVKPEGAKKMALAKNKRGLFQVILVDPKEKKVLLNTMVIADSIEDVLLEVDAGKVIKDANLSVSDVDKIVNIIGQIRKTRKNKTGEIELINEDSEGKE